MTSAGKKPSKIDRLIACIERMTNTIAANTRAVEAMTKEMQTPMLEDEEAEDVAPSITFIDGTRLDS